MWTLLSEFYIHNFAQQEGDDARAQCAAIRTYVHPTGRPYPEVVGLAITLMFDTLFAWLNVRHASAHWVCLVPNIHGLMNKYGTHAYTYVHIAHM